MVAYTDETPTAEIVIQGIGFAVPQPYKEGHPLTAGEASQLNQVLAENLRNNFASKVEAARADYRKANGLAENADVAGSMLDTEALQSALDTYATEYEFGIRKGGGVRAPVDPVEREAYKIAETLLKAAFKQRGIKLESVSKDDFSAKIKEILEAKPEIREIAKRRVEELSLIGSEAIGAAA